VERISAFLGLDQAEFMARHTLLRNGNREIGTKEDGACHFLADKVCSIHPVKPAVCRLWPWLPGALADEMGFLSLKQDCPGVAREATWEDFKAQHRAETSGPGREKD
jgi:Fe-S-cluster containining protein